MDGARDRPDQAPELTPGGPGSRALPAEHSRRRGNRGMMKEHDAGGLPGPRDAGQVVNSR